MNHSWINLKSDHSRKDYLDECKHCKARRIKSFINGRWIMKYFQKNNVFARFAPECIRVNISSRKNLTTV